MVNFLQKFTPDPVGIFQPLIALAKKEAGKEVAKRWSPEHDQAYAKVKQVLIKAPVLRSPGFLQIL